MINSHKLTIALLTHNRCTCGFLREALDAVLAQSYQDFELLVIDNHSTDNTPDLISHYEDPRLTYIRRPPGGNATKSYFSAMMMSSGEYIILTHDDDIMERTMIEKQMLFVEKHPDLLCVGSNVSLIDEKGSLIQDRLYNVQENIFFPKAEYIKCYLEEKLWLPAPTLLFKREPYLKTAIKWLGVKDHVYLASGDIWILMTLNLQGPIGLIGAPLLRYRQHGGQESRNVDQGYPMIEAIQLLLKNHGRKASLRPHLPAINGYLARFGTQNVCFKSSTRNQLLKGIAGVKKKWEKAVVPRERALDMVLPLEILLHLMGKEPTVGLEEIRRLNMLPAKGGARRGYRAWLNAILDGKNIFDSLPHVKKIGIFGSMLNAYLLSESAERAGIEVGGCFDSSPSRIDSQVLKVPVFPLADLSMKGRDLDAIILSSEHDQEDALRKIINQYLPEKKPLPVISWKEMANKASSKKECI